jgi:hypothetical protein
VLLSLALGVLADAVPKDEVVVIVKLLPDKIPLAVISCPLIGPIVVIPPAPKDTCPPNKFCIVCPGWIKILLKLDVPVTCNVPSVKTFPEPLTENKGKIPLNKLIA